MHNKIHQKINQPQLPLPQSHYNKYSMLCTLLIVFSRAAPTNQVESRVRYSLIQSGAGAEKARPKIKSAGAGGHNPLKPNMQLTDYVSYQYHTYPRTRFSL